jgi:hypothetical protein
MLRQPTKQDANKSVRAAIFSVKTLRWVLFLRMLTFVINNSVEVVISMFRFGMTGKTPRGQFLILCHMGVLNEVLTCVRSAEVLGL